MTKTVMIIDGGGRGAALVDAYRKSKQVGKILVIPGNDLMQINTPKKVTTYPNLKTTSVKEILEIAKREEVDLVDVAQDNAVEVGLVDELQNLGIPAFGPTKLAGQIEWDKSWSRQFMDKYEIPHPSFFIFKSEKAGINFVKQSPGKKWFIKASGLAEGKGAIPANDAKEAIKAIKKMSKFGSAGKTFLLEEWLEGEEFSAFALCDGKSFKIVGFAQDHKRVFDGDKGENTGGMGCVSNPLIIDQNIKKQTEKIFKKVVKWMKYEGRPYKGVLYLGGMVVKDRVYIIEFNARWGDPEAQILIPSINNDFVELTKSIIYGKLDRIKIRTDKKTRVVVAACSKGYPVDYSKVKGKKILGLDKVNGIKIYGAGVKKVNGEYVVNGGRVLYLMGEGRNVIEARKKVYKIMKLISIEGNNLHYRTDIGFRDVDRLKK